MNWKENWLLYLGIFCMALGLFLVIAAKPVAVWILS